jgi:hypothetical protein
MGAVDTQGLNEFAGAVGEALLCRRFSPPAGHQVGSLAGFQRPNQDSPGNAFLFRDQVEKKMVSIAEINISVPGRTEHDPVPWGPAPGGMAPRVVFGKVGLHLNDPARGNALRTFMGEDLAQQVAGHLKGGAGIIGTGVYHRLPNGTVFIGTNPVLCPFNENIKEVFSS